MRKHRAILKGKVWEEYWEMELPSGAFERMYHSSFYQMDNLLRDRDIQYRSLHSMNQASCIKKHRLKSHEEFWTGEIDMPFLEVGERLFIADMDVEVTVEERIRTTEENTCIYIVDYDVRASISDDLKETKEHVLRSFNEEREALIKDIAELDREIEEKEHSEESLSETLETRKNEKRECASEKSGLVPWLKRLIERD